MYYVHNTLCIFFFFFVVILSMTRIFYLCPPQCRCISYFGMLFFVVVFAVDVVTVLFVVVDVAIVVAFVVFIVDAELVIGALVVVAVPVLEPSTQRPLAQLAPVGQALQAAPVSSMGAPMTLPAGP